MFQETTALKKIRGLKKRLRIVQGGSSAGKTIAILLILIAKAQKHCEHCYEKERDHPTKTCKFTRATPRIHSVVSETMPHLKRGAIRDFLNIMEAHGYYDDERWNRSEFIYTFETGSKLEFFSADSSDKVRGPRRNGDLFINECNNVLYETYTQLSIRTEGDIYLDYNPVVEFWVQDEIISKGVEHDFLILTYKDNGGLPETIVKELESRRGNVAWWRVYGEGLVGEIEGRVYTGWKLIDEIPHEARLLRHCLDFGFYPDPAAIVDIYTYNGGYIFDEVLHQNGLHDPELAQAIKNLPSALTVADCAEPKAISAIAQFGISIVPTKKGPDSKRWGISVMQGEQISVTKRSLNLIGEYRRYMLAQDAEGRFIPGETVGKDDCIDAARYGMTSLVPIIQRQDMIANMPRLYQKPRVNPVR